MRDAISMQRANLLHPAIRKEVIKLIEQAEAGFPETTKIRMVQGLRTIDEQNALFALGRKKPGHIVTYAKGGQSYHNYGLAFDFAIMYDKDANGNFEDLSWDTNYDFDKDGIKDWQEVVKVFKQAGYTWGGDWPGRKEDDPHVEKIFGYNWRQLLEKYNAKQFIAATNYVLI